MYRSLFFAAMFVFGLAGSVRSDDTAQQVVQKAVQAHGGAAALKKHAGGEYKVEGTAIIAGENTKFSSAISYALPDKFRMSFDTTVLEKKSNVTVIVNGDKVKETANGKVEEVKEPVRSEFKQLASNQQVSLLYPLLESEFTLKAEKDAAVDGKDAAVVLVTKKGMKDIRLFFEKESGRLVKSSRKGLNALGQEVEEETLMSDFKEFDGVLLPVTQKVKQASKDYMTLKLIEVKLAEKPDLKAFVIE
jgi:ribosome assembly protein YihI (activator of Der GTPase)